MIELDTLYNEHCHDTMKRMADNSINMAMTSPPYWALRDYGTGDDQLGLEPTFDEYINNLCDIFDEVKRVLRKDGTCWINIGDTYAGSGKGIGTDREKCKEVYTDNDIAKTDWKKLNYPSKSLIMIPFRFAIEMVNRGWILRNTIIWHKRNCMPSSAKDRFTVDFEYLFFFVKNKKYWFEQQFDKYTAPLDRWGGDNVSKYEGKFTKGGMDPEKSGSPRARNLRANYPERARDLRPNDNGRNKRTIWTINPTPFKDAHFAVYPEKLCETPIKAGCPEFICKKCGKPREKIIEIGDLVPDAPCYKPRGTKRGNGFVKNAMTPAGKKQGHPNFHYEKEVVGLTDCGCNAGFTGGIVYDPFAGSGTTCLVAHRLNRKFIGSEIKKEYCEIAEKRLAVTKQEQFA